MAQELKKGGVVTVFREPLTETRPEGTAMLNKQISVIVDGEWGRIERWNVTFIADSFETERLILAL